MVITPPNGTKDFNSKDCKLRKLIFDKLIFIAESHSFQPLETPSIERIETMEGKYGEEGEKLFFKILKRGEHANTGECDLSLRYDLTVPAMRYYVANKGQLPKIFKRYQYGPVWRAERPAKDRYRQFYQFDFDIYGSTSISADIECLNVTVDCLKALGIEDFYIRLNSRKLLHALMKEFDIPENMYQAIIIQIDKVDKTGIEGLKENLNPYKEIGKVAELIKIFLAENYNNQFLNILESHEENKETIKELQNIIKISETFVESSKIKIDMTLARGIDYYTGPIYEIEIPGIKGSIAAGGRYNNLAKLFIKDEVPVCGSSLGIERIIPLVNIDAPDINTSADIYISNSDDDFKTIYQLAIQIRKMGYSVEIQKGASGKFRKELSYANQLGVNFFIYQGENEKTNDKFFLKDMQGTQVEGVYSFVEVVDFFNKTRHI